MILGGGGAPTRMEVTDDKYGVPFWSDENVLKLVVVTMAQPCQYAKNLIVLFKWLKYIVYEFYHNKVV